MSRSSPKKKLVILDIDHTLIHSLLPTTPAPHPTRGEPPFILPLPNNETYHVHKRKHLKTFIDALRRYSSDPSFKVAVWTAAQRDYATRILDKIWPSWPSDLLFFRSYNHCTITSAGDILKDMRKLPQGYDTLLVDDSPVHYAVNTANNFSVWKIKPFHATSPTPDNELLQVLDYIDQARVRAIPFAIRPKTPPARPNSAAIGRARAVAARPRAPAPTRARAPPARPRARPRTAPPARPRSLVRARDRGRL